MPGDVQRLGLMALAALVRHKRQLISRSNRQMMHRAAVPERPALTKAQILDYVSLSDILAPNADRNFFAVAELETQDLTCTLHKQAVPYSSVGRAIRQGLHGHGDLEHLSKLRVQHRSYSIQCLGGLSVTARTKIYVTLTGTIGWDA